MAALDSTPRKASRHPLEANSNRVAPDPSHAEEVAVETGVSTDKVGWRLATAAARNVSSGAVPGNYKYDVRSVWGKRLASALSSRRQVDRCAQSTGTSWRQVCSLSVQTLVVDVVIVVDVVAEPWRAALFMYGGHCTHVRTPTHAHPSSSPA